MKKFVGLVGLAAIGLVAVILVRTLRFTPPPIEVENPVAFEVDADLVAQHLSEAVQFRTISPPSPARREDQPFDAFLAWTEATYPALHAQLDKTIVAQHTLLFTWPGNNPDLHPILLAAHYDVVPVVPGTEDNWTHPPFDGVIADGQVWGRGALDDKSGVIVMMEAASLLLRQGFEPQRTVYLAFDHDEEIGGREGAAGVTALLKDQGVHFAWSIDEGSFILKDFDPGIEVPIARIGIAEKGYMTLDLVAHGDSGHSSMPTKDASIFLLAAAINRLRETPIPGGLDGVSLEANDAMARHSSFSQRMLFANRWLFQGIIEKLLSKSAPGNASLRTTTAPTLLSAGIKDSVLPGKATATVNFRLHPRDTPESVTEAVKEIVDDDRIDIVRRGKGLLASGVSSTEGLGYQVIATVSRQMFGPLVVVPGMIFASTNSKHYATIADDAYRINLLLLGPQDIARFHGANERISVENLGLGTAAYARLITLGAGE